MTEQMGFTGILPCFVDKPELLDVYIVHVPSLVHRLFQKCVQVYIAHNFLLVYLEHAKYLAALSKFIGSRTGGRGGTCPPKIEKFGIKLLINYA